MKDGITKIVIGEQTGMVAKDDHAESLNFKKILTQAYQKYKLDIKHVNVQDIEVKDIYQYVKLYISDWCYQFGSRYR